MTFDEIYCQFCGVSASIGRIRTKDEPASAGWSSSGVGNVPNNNVDCNDCFTVDDHAQDLMDEEEDTDDQQYEYSSDAEAGIDPYEYQSPAESDVEDDDEPDNAPGSNRRQSNQRWQDFLEELEQPEKETITLYTGDFPASNEHVAGLGCVSPYGYNGNNISAKEMKGCQTFQVLCQKPKRRKWRARDDDEEFENETSTVCLSGLCDNLSSKTKTNRDFFPTRHDPTAPVVSNHITPRFANRTGFAFHPACFEVFKRASLHRNGKVDIEALMDWFRLEGTRTRFFDKFPRAQEVRDSSQETWQHRAGDEWLAANPCHIPGLEKFFKRHHNAKLQTQNCPRDFLAEYPWIWELWCNKPYSGWSVASETELRQEWKVWQEQRDFLVWDIKLMEKEKELDNEQAAHLDDLRDALENLIDKEPTIKLRPALEVRQVCVGDALVNDARAIKGLKNRERIWKDCQYILKRIERHQLKGRMGDGIVIDTVALHADGAPEYSDDSDDEGTNAKDENGMEVDLDEFDAVNISMAMDMQQL